MIKTGEKNENLLAKSVRKKSPQLSSKEPIRRNRKNRPASASSFSVTDKSFRTRKSNNSKGPGECFITRGKASYQKKDERTYKAAYLSNQTSALQEYFRSSL